MNRAAEQAITQLVFYVAGKLAEQYKGLHEEGEFQGLLRKAINALEDDEELLPKPEEKETQAGKIELEEKPPELEEQQPHQSEAEQAIRRSLLGLEDSGEREEARPSFAPRAAPPRPRRT
jgi:hypothetical protein